MLKQLLDANDLTQKDLAAKLGVKPSSVNQWVKGTSRPDPRRLAQLASELGVTVDMLLTGQMPTPQVVEAGIQVTGNVKSISANFSELYTHVPFLSARAQAGLPTMSFENCELKLEETYPVFLPAVTLTKRHLVIELVGDSMEPEIKNGAIVLATSVPKNDIKYESGGVYAVMYANRFVVKRIKTNDIAQSGTLTLWSDNERYGHITINASDIQCVWKIVGKVYESVR